MKKILSLVLFFVLSLGLFSGLGLSAGAEEVTLRVYNWQEYIDDGTDENGTKVVPSVMEEWAADYYARTGVKVTVRYDTFETNETMLNTLKTGKSQYDLVCPSDYVIQKMIAATEKGTDENIALEKFDYSKLPNFTKYASPYIKQVFEENGFDAYSVGYMWGTVGIIYNPEAVDPEDTKSWDILWDTDYKNRITVKDSVRDAYIPAVVAAHKDEIVSWNQRLAQGTVTLQEYRTHLGIDIATAAGAEVCAVADGTVSQIWEDPLMGWCVALTHAGDCVTVYKNLAKDMAQDLAVNTEIKKGQLLGYVGDSAIMEIAEEPHLHMEMTVKGLQVDPLDYFSAAVITTLSEDTIYEQELGK